MTQKIITIRLTEDEARHVFFNADGWMDAGACDGGLEPDERAALHKLCEQIRKKVSLRKPSPVPSTDGNSP